MKIGFRCIYNLTFRTFLIAILILSMNRNGMAQYDNQVLRNVAANYERVYVQLDRTAYVAGSAIRYRSFLLDASLLQYEIKSKILYFELAGSDPSQSIQWRVNMHNGKCSGSLVLPSDLKSGMYSLKAFTNWMKNGKPEYFFSADILIIEISEEIQDDFPIEAEPVTDSRIIAFHPEGGQLIDGIACKVGFKVNLKIDGLYPDTITIVEDDSIIMKQRINGELGFGSFPFVPDASKGYYAQLLYVNGQATRVSLPYIGPYGYSMQVEKAAGGLNVRISGKSMYHDQELSFHFVAISHGHILLDSSYNTSGDSHVVFIPSERLHTGIVNLTLYDSKRFILSQRLYYYDVAESGPVIKIKGNQNSYSTGEQIQMELSVDGISGDDTVSMAVSVSQQHPFQHFIKHMDIDQYLFLFSEINNLSFSGRNLSGITEEQIQDLLLCVDADDYAWNYSSSAKLPDCSYDMENKGFILKGTIRSRMGNDPLAYAHVLINVVDSIAPRIVYAQTDATGTFYAVLSSFYDNKNIMMQVVEDYNNSDIVWELEEKKLQDYTKQTMPYTISEAEKKYIEQSINIRIIEAVYEDDTKDSTAVKTSIPEIQFLTPNAVIYPAEFTELANFKEIVDNILPAVRFTNRNQRYLTGIFDKPHGIWLENNMVFLNGILFKDLAYVAILGSKDIKRIEIHNTNLMCGDLTFPGFISIYTYDGQIPEHYLKNNVFAFTNEVIPEDRAVQKAGLGTDKTSGPEHPDFRQILFWAPDVQLADSDKVTIEFSTSQLKGLYGVNIQGITSSGIPLHTNFDFKVE